MARGRSASRRPRDRRRRRRRRGTRRSTGRARSSTSRSSIASPTARPPTTTLGLRRLLRPRRSAEVARRRLRRACSGKLDYLTDLGVGALWITPAAQQAAGPTGTCGYHGYWADYADPDDGAVEPRLGTAAELTGLVGALHARRHAPSSSTWSSTTPGDHARVVTQHPDWFHDPATCAQLGDPAIYCPYRAGISDFAQEKPAVADLSVVAVGGLDVALRARRHSHGHREVRAARRTSTTRGCRRCARCGRCSSSPRCSTRPSADLKPYLDAGFDSTFNFPLRGALRRRRRRTAARSTSSPRCSPTSRRRSARRARARS